MEPQEQYHHHPETLPPPTCCKCGGPTALAAPPPSCSPPPNYRPIRAPAINIPPNSNSQQAIILAPVPQPKPVPPISPPFHFQPPSKQIQSPDDIRRFHDSPSGQHFLGFVVALSQSIRSKKISDPCHVSPVTSTLVSILDTLLCWVGEIPPTQQAARYGNVSYRVWHDRVVQNAPHMMLKFLPPHLEPSTVEIVPYFTDAFGNPSRIDYGTGHETNFAAWLYCLARMEVIKEEDYPAVVARVFVKYLELMRKLQLVYCLEPAGSHGVWGLDDYHFLPFIFGSSQLIDHKYVKPKSIHNDDILENFSEEYMYLSGVAFVKKVKKGPFSEHSPLLDDVSGVPNWNKVNSGMLKMYKVEVLEKVPIMQHYLFGWLIKWHYSSLEVALEYFRCGADKISIGSDAVYAAEEYLRTGVKSGKSSLEQISRVYGNQAVVVSIDPCRVYVKNQNDVKFKTIRVTNPGPNGEEYAWYQCTVSGGREGRPIGAYELAKAVEELGAGEILLNCIDCDGQGKGFDIDLLKLISDAVTIPVIASSGAGSV